MENIAEFDIGPLTWVKGEIDQALMRALAALRAYAADPSDAVQLRYSQTHFHQAHGALQIVGLDGVARFSEEIEGLLVEIGQGPVKQESLSLVERGFSAISAYLEQLLAGQPNQPLRLFQLYRELVLARNKQEPDPVELYFPGFAGSAPDGTETDDLDADDRKRTLHKEQVRFQRGLLRWLRGRDTAGAREMATSIGGIERLEASPPLRAFWWTARTLADALAEGHVNEEAGLPRLWPRVERQMARILKGSPTVAERLAREVLFHIARTHPATAPLREVQHAFRLAGTVPEKFELAIEDAAHLPRLRAMKDIVQNAKTAWTRYASGHTPTVAPFCEYAVQLRDRSAGLNRWELARISEEMVAVADKFLEIQGPIEEGIALEMATALLLVEDAVEKFTTLPPEFGRQCQAMIDRLRLWREKKEIALGSPTPLLEDVARRAQERMAIAQMVAEIQTNLRSVEQALDAFFRDPTRQVALAGMDRPLAQVGGAFRILSDQRAAETIEECVELVRRFTNPGYRPNTEDFEYVAGLLSAVGFHADALQHGASDLESALRPVRDRHADVGTRGELPSATVETELAERQRESLAQLEAWREAPDNRERKEDLRQTLTAIKHDAGIVADAELEKQAGKALSLLDEAGSHASQQQQLVEVMQSVAPQPEPVPAPSRETEKLAESAREVIDAELLEIYLQEAAEMLGMIHEHLEYIRRQPASPDGLPPIRRGFHTLKGSGRMVGLMSLADTAYAVEKVLNQFLEAERPATEDLLRLIELAERYFSDAIAALKGGRPVASGAAVAAAAAEVRLDDPTVTVGSKKLPEGLFNIFLNEARSHMATLRAAHEGLAAKGEISEDYERAAHTLGGIAGTTNFLPLHDLATAVETALGRAATPVPQGAREIFAGAIDALDSMVQNISRGVEPEGAAGIISRLEALDTLDVKRPAAQGLPPAGTPNAAPNAAPSAAPHSPGRTGPHASPPQATRTGAHAVFEEPASYGPVASAPVGEAPAAIQVPAAEAPATTRPPAAEAPATTRAPAAEAPATTRPPAAEAPAATRAPVAEAPAPVQAPAAAVAAAPMQVPITEVPITEGPYTGVPHTSLAVPAAGESPPELPADDIDPELLALFVEEGQELFPAVGAALRDWHADPSSPEGPRALQRALHTLKGSARMAGAMGLGQLLHDMETRTENTMALSNPPAEIIAHLEAQYDRATVLFDYLQRGEQPPRPAAAPGGPAPHAQRNVQSAPSAAPAGPSAGPAPKIAEPAPNIAEALPQAVEPAPHIIEPVARFFEPTPHAVEPTPQVVEPAPQVVEPAPQVVEPASHAVEPAPHAVESALHVVEPIARIVEPAAPIVTAPPAVEPPVSPVEVAPRSVEPAPAAPQPVAPQPAAAVEQRAAAPQAAAAAPAPVVSAPAAAIAAAPIPSVVASEAERIALLRVRADMVDRLVNSVGEVAISRGRIEGEMRTLKGALGELTENVSRLRHQLREVEIQAETQIQSRMVASDDKPFDPLEFDRFTRFQELTRMMAESVNDVATVHGNINRALDETEAALNAQQRLSRDLQQDLLRVRMVPFSSIGERLYRTVRQAAKETAKRATLDIRNGQVELDRSVLERITAPFEHMLRNAVVHGLELPDDRRARGKDETGEITIEVRAEGNQISLTVADDGRGLDLQRIRARAVSVGLLGPDDPADEAQLFEMIFQPGFSTAETVTQLAGRGVGMDIVRSEISAIGGRVEIKSESGKGTAFHISLPLTLVVTQAVLVTVGGAKYLVPSAMVEQVRQVRDAELVALYREAAATSMTGRRVPFFYLPRLLGDSDAQPGDSNVATVLFVRTGNAGAALHVETVQGNQEIVVKNTGPMLSRITGVTGATVLGSGEIVLILNPLLLSQRMAAARVESKAERVAAPVATKENLTVLVVDDSLTVRRATERLLTREGYNVLTARDGVNALEVLQTAMPAVMLVDIEMPRMDGFDLTRNVRADERLKDVPIIMITSRTAEKHRQVAFDLGVSAFLGKPYREDELLHHIRTLARTSETVIE